MAGRYDREFKLEADTLKADAMETVRDIYDRMGCPMVLVGMPGLGRKLSRHAQLYSRIGFVNEFSTLSFEEMCRVLPMIEEGSSERWTGKTGSWR